MTETNNVMLLNGNLFSGVYDPQFSNHYIVRPILPKHCEASANATEEQKAAWAEVFGNALLAAFPGAVSYHLHYNEHHADYVSGTDLVGFDHASRPEHLRDRWLLAGDYEAAMENNSVFQLSALDKDGRMLGKLFASTLQVLFFHLRNRDIVVPPMDYVRHMEIVLKQLLSQESDRFTSIELSFKDDSAHPGFKKLGGESFFSWMELDEDDFAAPTDVADLYATGKYWELHWNPHTQVGFYRIMSAKVSSIFHEIETTDYD